MQKLSASLAPRCKSYFGIAPRCKARCKLFLILGAKLGATCSALDVQNLMCKSGCQSGSFPLSTHRSRRIFALFRAPSELWRLCALLHIQGAILARVQGTCNGAETHSTVAGRPGPRPRRFATSRCSARCQAHLDDDTRARCCDSYHTFRGQQL